MSKLRVPVGPHDHIRGSANSAVTLVEYGDYQCPYCAAAHPIVRMLEGHYRTVLRLVYRHFPLVEVHPFAVIAAETAEYAGENDRFWEMHDAIFVNNHRLSPQLLFALAGTLGLSQMGLRDSIEHSRHAAKIQSDFMGGARSGVNGTPTFFINGQRHDGGFSLPEMSAAIEDALQTVAPAR